MPEMIYLSVISIYFIVICLITLGLRKKYSRLSETQLPTITVIVAARNEENNITGCLTSLNNLIYPDKKIEVIIVDDFSEDKTGLIIDEFIIDKAKFRKVIPDNNPLLKGKVNALASAVKVARGEVILLTDADCEVTPTWAKTLASFYKEGIGMVNGFTLIDDDKIFSRMQGIDLVFLLSVASGLINIKYPVSSIGNNMSFRRMAYLEAGGFEKFPFSVTEDFALLHGINLLKKYKIIYPLLKDSIVRSKPCVAFKDLINQKKRWGRGGMQAPLGGYIIMSTAFLSNLIVLLTPLFFSPVWLYLAFFKITVDYFFLYPVFNILELKDYPKYFIFFQVYFILYTTILPLILIFNRKISWKGRIY
jgi:cellulose synthase/poly-beta-1,6-N-acetylglucosamine synthase-like glycosyltransferase